MMRPHLTALGLGLVLAGCAAVPDHPQPKPLAGRVDLSGRWTSTWGAMTLRQEGVEVQGEVAYRHGTLAGVVDGDLLIFRWSQPRDREQGVLAAEGKGWMRIAADGSTLNGAWGYRDRYEGGGGWQAERWADDE